MIRFLRVSLIIFFTMAIMFVFGVWHQTVMPRKRYYESEIKKKKNIAEKEYQLFCSSLATFTSVQITEDKELKNLFIASREADNVIGVWIQENVPGEDIDKIQAVHDMILDAREQCFSREKKLLKLESQYADFLKKNPICRYVP